MQQISIAKSQGLENPFANKETEGTSLLKPSEEKKLEIAQKTAAALGLRVTSKTDAAYVTSTAFKAREPDKYVKLKPAALFGTQESNKLIKITTQESDPLQPPRFKHKRIPRGVPSPPPAVLHSPQRKLTLKDQQDMKVPPCISNWKNAKGHIIPLHMRLMADGRNIQDLSVNSRFGSFSEALYTAEKEARKEIEERNKLLTRIDLIKAKGEEERLRTAANNARKEKISIMASNISSVAYTDRIRRKDDVSLQGKRKEDEEELTAAQREREAIRRQKRYELRRDQRIEAARKKKAKFAGDEEREVTEKIALGVAQPTSKETMYDQRLFNQSAGVTSGFGDEDDYNLYDKPLFADRTETALHKIKRTDNEGVENERLKKLVARTKGSEGAETVSYTHLTLPTSDLV
eukprot:TRINITY_DN8189_c0_g1_i8.p1 TRINITY_DN8189_c0_g1~~TRINITY_DN8189_c0_g1_i8.p1  ORF type:complete len:430 (-),score=137.48 TRINITY_DN8189_c0_g1_i8:42-1256(-)